MIKKILNSITVSFFSFFGLFMIILYTGYVVGKDRGQKNAANKIQLTKERLTYQNIKYKLQRDECFLFVNEIVKQPQTKEKQWY
tara:strand:+ start:2294 stop:2545 length:252 start_codon:yes stop_codon:yes gene_type:complete